jgi:uracil-DNA glycosylase family 4
MPSLLQIHTNAWKNCQRCPLHKMRKNVCICRGQVPAEILFIGEAPGDSEDVFGIPFYGPAGKLLDKIISNVDAQIAKANSNYVPASRCWTNLVGCIPKTPAPERRKVEPLPSEISSCYPRLDYFITLCNPKLIIAVGELAAGYGKTQHWEHRAKVVPIVHPAAILRAGKEGSNLRLEQKWMQIQRTEIALRDAFIDLDIPF